MSEEEAGTSVFLSYSRKDSAFVDRLGTSLGERGFRVLRDVDDILPAEQWRGRLEQLITDADGIVFVLSPHSLGSEVCAWEVALAAGLGKRLVPVLAAEVDPATAPGGLAERNWLDLRAMDEAGLAALGDALNTDVEWVREHTRLTGLARDWSAAERRADGLLRGAALDAAEGWLAARPKGELEVPELLRVFLVEGRRRANRLRTRITLLALLVAVAAVGLALAAEVSRRDAVDARDGQARALTEAEEQREAAETQRALAEEQREAAEAATRQAQQEEALALARLSGFQLAEGDTTAAIDSGLKAVEVTGAEAAPPEVERALYQAVWAHRLVATTEVARKGALEGLSGKRVAVVGEGFRDVYSPQLEPRRGRAGRPLAIPEGRISCGESVVTADWYDSVWLGEGEYRVRVGDYITNQDYSYHLGQHAAYTPDCGWVLLSGAHDALDWEQPRVLTVSFGVYSALPVATLGGHETPVRGLAVGPRGERWYTLTEAGVLRAWSPRPEVAREALRAQGGAALNASGRVDPETVTEPRSLPAGLRAAIASEDCFEGAVLVESHDLAYCLMAGGDAPQLRSLSDPSRALPVFPEAVRDRVNGLGSHMRVAPHPSCRRALVSFETPNPDVLYDGGAVYVDLDRWAIVADAPKDQTVAAFCTLEQLARYARAVR